MHEISELEKRVARLEDMVQAIIDQINMMVEGFQKHLEEDTDIKVYHVKILLANGEVLEKDVVTHNLDKLRMALYRAFPGCKILELYAVDK